MNVNRQPVLGVFLPMANGGWIISETAPRIDGSFALNREVAILSEQLGYDFILSMMKWRGYGGSTNHWGESLEAMMLMSALSQCTSRIKIWATVHTILYHPAIAAKMLMTLDQASNGRAGVNIVSGAFKDEFAQMGLWPEHLDHTQRYAYTDEWVTVLKKLWEEPRVDFDGEFFKLADCVSDPKPVGGRRPELICAGMSETGLRFTAQHCDSAFVAGSTEAEISKVSKRAKEIAAEYGKTLKTFAMYTLIPGSSQAEADERVEHYIAGTDQVAVTNMVASYGRKPDGKETALVSRSRGGFMTSRLAGTPEALSEQIIGTLRGAELDGMMLIFADYIEDLKVVGEQVLPRVRSAFGGVKEAA
jgi:pyrimidine oxygenase